MPDADTIPVGNDLLTLDRSVALLRSAALLKDARIDSALLDRLVYARRCLTVDENVAVGTGLRMLFERATEHDREKCAIAALRNWHFYGSVWPPSVNIPPTRHGGGGVGSGMAVGRHDAAAPTLVDRMRRAGRRPGQASSAVQRRGDTAEHSSPPAMDQFEASLREAGAVATFADGREAAVTGQTPEPPAHARPICAVVQVAADVPVDVCDTRTPVYPVGDESSHTYPSTQVLATVSATEEAAVADLAIETGDPACHPNTVSAQRRHAFVENERVENERVENERVPPHEYDCETSSMLQHLPEIVKKVNSNNQGTLVQGLTMLYDMVSSPDFAGEPDPMNAVIDTGVVTRLVALLKKDNIATAQSYALQIVALLFRVMDRLGQLLFEHRVFPLISRLIRSPAPSVVSAAVWAVAVLAGVNYSGPSQPMCVMVRAKLKSNGVAERLVDALKAGTLAREDALCVATTISLFFDQRTEEIFDLTLPVFAEFVTSPETSDVLTTLRGLRSMLSDERAIQRVMEANLLKPVVLKLTDRDSYVQCSALHVIFRMSQHGNEEQLQALVDHGVLYTFGVLLSSRDAEIQRVAR